MDQHQRAYLEQWRRELQQEQERLNHQLVNGDEKLQQLVIKRSVMKKAQELAGKGTDEYTKFAALVTELNASIRAREHGVEKEKHEARTRLGEVQKLILAIDEHFKA